MDFIFSVLEKSRDIFKSLLESHTLDELNTIPHGFNNNIIWNIGHIVVTQQVLMYKLSGLPVPISETLIQKYQKGTKPEQPVTLEEVNELKSLLFTTLEQSKMDYKKSVFKTFMPYTVQTTGNALRTLEEAMQFALFHEGLHFGVVKGLSKSVKF
ncbi:DinB family protein [Formosa sp. S-31]|uniref:DinB family protein n=1 Tax=Formosa sp. S-31 TaxID=2790949 RepID=UPI003EBE6E2A